MEGIGRGEGKGEKMVLGLVKIVEGSEFYIVDVIDQLTTNISRSTYTLLAGCSGLTSEDKIALGSFLGTSVTAGIVKAYDGQWEGWCTFVENLG